MASKLPGSAQKLCGRGKKENAPSSLNAQNFPLYAYQEARYARRRAAQRPTCQSGPPRSVAKPLKTQGSNSVSTVSGQCALCPDMGTCPGQCLDMSGCTLYPIPYPYVLSLSLFLFPIPIPIPYPYPYPYPYSLSLSLLPIPIPIPIPYYLYALTFTIYIYIYLVHMSPQKPLSYNHLRAH
mgnify:CR=1 FL=1